MFENHKHFWCKVSELEKKIGKFHWPYVGATLIHVVLMNYHWLIILSFFVSIALYAVLYWISLIQLSFWKSFPSLVLTWSCWNIPWSMHLLHSICLLCILLLCGMYRCSNYGHIWRGIYICRLAASFAH